MFFSKPDALCIEKKCPKMSVVILGEDLNLIETFSIPYNYVTTEYICMIFGDNIYGYHICDNRQFLLRKILVRWS